MALRVAPLVGPVVGPKVGPNGDTDPFTGVSRDATSLIYVPANATEWNTFRSAAALAVANPASLWLCQEASGNLADSIGSLALVAANAPAYQQAVTGWTRLGVGGTDGGTERFSAAAGSGPSPATTSQTWLWIASLPTAPATSRAVCGLRVNSATTSFRALHVATTGLMRAQVVGVNTDSSGAISSEVHAIVMKYDRTNSVANLYNLDEKVVGTYSAGVTDGEKGILSGTAARVLYGCMWSGGDAEISDANIKALLQAMGFTVAWS